jgi:glycosyltransferase involved in cell wall biosynthesis
MLVSVVIPLYNKVRHIKRAVDSVLAQSIENFELVVVDDGSTDGGGEVVSQMVDRRIRLLRQSNGGVSAARNRGIGEARSEVVAFLDADDEWSPIFLATVLDLYARFPTAGMFATAYRCRENDASWRPIFTGCPSDPRGGLIEEYFRAAGGPHPVLPSAVMIPKSILQEVGGFPHGVAWGEDVMVWVAIALRHRVAWSPIEGAIHHLSADNRAYRGPTTRPDLVVAPLVTQFLASGQEPVSPRAVIEDYLFRWRLEMALERHMRGMGEPTKELLERAGASGRFRWRWLTVRLALLLPPRMILTLKRTRRRSARLARRVLGPPYRVARAVWRKLR